MAEWTFLTKHALALSLIAKYPLITAQELAVSIGTTERQVRKIIADLYFAGYVEKKKVGRNIEYAINTDLKLRHSAHSEVGIGDFLAALKAEKGRNRFAGII